VGLKQDLEDLLGSTVDIGSERGLHWYIRSGMKSCGKQYRYEEARSVVA
jgi:predicted nucleotidyltransferase